MFKKTALLILSIGMLAACAAPIAPATPTTIPATPTIAPTTAPTRLPATATAIPPTAVPTEKYRPYKIVKIAAPSLISNLVGESAEREIQIYLPPSYNTSNKHYPVVYYLPGYGDSGMIGFYLPDEMDKLIQSGKVKDMIVVVANGVNRLGGSFYVNSPVTGNWEDFIARDVVSYVDSHYRTLAQPASRGLTGHSMGGFGALNIAMHRPDVFGAVYSMSPGLFDENGLRESQIFISDSLIKSFIDYEKKLSSLPEDQAKQSMFGAPQDFALSYGYAFAPNANRKPPYFDYPFKEVNGQLVRDDAVWQKWDSGFGGIAAEAKQYKDNWLKLKGIVVDYGTNDEYAWIPKGSAYFGEQMKAAGIPVKVEVFEGSHQSELGNRISDHMLPFFSTKLQFE